MLCTNNMQYIKLYVTSILKIKKCYTYSRKQNKNYQKDVMSRTNSFFVATLFLIAHTSILPEQKATILDEAHRGETEKIQKRLDNDEDCSQSENETGDTALHIAAEQGHTEIVDLLTTQPDRS